MNLGEFPDVGKVADVARVLDCNVKTVYNLIEGGRLEAIRLGERGLRVTKHALFNFLHVEEDEPPAPGLRLVGADDG